MRILLGAIIILAMAANTPSSGNDQSPYVEMAYRIRSSVTQQLMEQYDLTPFGFSGGMMERVNTIGVSFNCYAPMSLDEARCFVLECARRYWDAFNEDEMIRPYLANYPFGPENIHLGFIFHQPDGGKVYSPFPSAISACNGLVIYYQVSERQCSGLGKQTVESYQEASQKAEEYMAEVGKPGFHLDKPRPEPKTRI